jgi:Helix-turn-helix of DDE superfamily endonuclease
MLRYTSERDKANQILNLTSLTIEQFEQLVDPFEQAFVHHMRQWTMEGKPRTARAYTPYANSPLPTAEDRLLFLLSYLKVASLQVAHGALFGMTQPNANKWLHILLVVLHQTLRNLGDAPARHLLALHERLAALETDVGQHAPAALETDAGQQALTALETDDAADAAPLFITMAPNDRSLARTTMLNKKRIIAARKSVTM